MWPLLLAVGLFLTAFAVTNLLTPWMIKHLTAVGIVGEDVHKKDRRKIPEMGGLAIVAGFVVAILAATGLSINIDGLSTIYLLAATCTILIVTLIGAADDLFELRQAVKAVLPLAAATPLMVIRAGIRSMSIPFFGDINFGPLYPLLLVPLGITGASNATNMLAGLNGLEVGLGILIHLTLLGASILLLPQNPLAIYAIIISASLLGGLVAFFRFNRYPSRIFPGDVTTLVIGCGLAAAVILGNLEKIGLILIAPFFVELLLKARVGFKGESFGKLEKDGTLSPPKKLISLTHVAMASGRRTEPQVIGILWGMQTVFCLLAILSVYLTLATL